MATVSKQLLDAHRDINVDDSSWYEHTMDEWVGKLLSLGIRTDVRQIAFSGFWSQGDGASFTGKIDTPQFLAAHPKLKERYPAIAWMAEYHSSGVMLEIVRISSHYCHSNTVRVGMDTDIVNDEESGSLREALFDVQWERFEQQSEDFRKEVDEICTDYMDELYSELEEEHDFQTSDDQVRETLIANEIFDEVEELENA